MLVRIIKKSEVSIEKQEFYEYKKPTRNREHHLTLFVVVVTRIVGGTMG
jgi:hypothetical protein